MNRVENQFLISKLIEMKLFYGIFLVFTALTAYATNVEAQVYASATPKVLAPNLQAWNLTAAKFINTLNQAHLQEQERRYDQFRLVSKVKLL